MGEYVADRVARLMKLKSIPIIEANILILGFSFKENCPDIRNTRVVDLVKKFLSYDCNVDVYDPWINSEDAIKEFSIEPVTAIANGKYDAIVLAVAHDIFKNMTEKQLRLAGKENHILFDVKYLKNSSEVDGRL